MIKEFKGFLVKQNALALAIGVIIGAAVGKVVTSIAEDVINPIIGLLLPGGSWRDAKIVLAHGVDAAGKPTETAITYGHLIGSRALCRLADTLRINCRAIDTAARYGGDEFALVLPEARETEAHLVAGRIREVLAQDQEKPQLSASIGISIYRGNGERIEKLLSEADQHLYAEKARRGKRHPTTLTPRRRIHNHKA